MCETVETGKSVVRAHNGRRAEVVNPKYWEIGVVQVDNCLITDTKRCDWLFRFPENRKLSRGIAATKLVELKGSDVLKGFNQLEATVVHPAFAADRQYLNECFIVSQVSPLLTGSVQVAKAKFYDAFHIHVNVVPVATMNALEP
jgi:hypothetical protein